MNSTLETTVDQALTSARRGYGEGVDASRLVVELSERGWSYYDGDETQSAERALDRANDGPGTGWSTTRLTEALLDAGWSFAGW